MSPLVVPAATVTLQMNRKTTRRNPAMVKGRKRSRNRLEQGEHCELPRLRLRPDLQAPQSVPDHSPVCTLHVCGI